MAYMFYECYYMTSFKASNWNTSKVQDLSYMFEYCSRLTSVDLSGWDVSSVTSNGNRFMPDGSTVYNNGMYGMFYYCSALRTIYCNYDWTGKASLNSASSVFYNDRNLQGYNSSYTGGSRCRPSR